MKPSEIADWWDEQKRESEDALMEWVKSNPQWWVIGIAGSTQTAMDLGQPFVDILRLGEGAKAGGWGYGEDALRLLAILGPAVKTGTALTAQLTKLFRSGRIRFAVQLGGVYNGPCTFQAINNALSIIKGKNASLYITIGDIWGAIRRAVPHPQWGQGLFVDYLIGPIRQTGAVVKEVTGLSRIEDVVGIARRENAPVIFAIEGMRRTMRGTALTLEPFYHTIIAMRTTSGKVRFADYGGKYHDTVESLINALAPGVRDIKLYQYKSSAVVVDSPAPIIGEYASKVAKGTVIVLGGLAAIETHENGVELAIPIVPVVAKNPEVQDPAPSTVVKGSFEAYKRRRKGRKIEKLPEQYQPSGTGMPPPVTEIFGIQYRLNALGFGSGPCDGIIGPLTRGATRDFQTTYPPLKVDGIPGRNTQSRLKEVCGY